MPFRVEIVTEAFDARTAAIRDAFQDYSADIKVQVLRRADGRPDPGSASRSVGTTPGSTLAALMSSRPHLVVCKDKGGMALQAAMFRRLSPRSRLLMFSPDRASARGLPGRALRWIADAALAEHDPVTQAIDLLRLPSSFTDPANASSDLGPFLAGSRERSEVQARRIVFAGDLSPQSGAADLMIAVASWAERNPARAVDLWWVGEGDLAGILDAQPLPPGVTQRFLGRLEPEAIAAAFAECGLLAVPSLLDDRSPFVVAALAAGLPVLGSRIDRDVRRWVADGVNGWLFNALEPEEVTRALSRALDSSLATLQQMRDCAQATVRPVSASVSGLGLSERLARALAAAESPAHSLAHSLAHGAVR